MPSSISLSFAAVLAIATGTPGCTAAPERIPGAAASNTTDASVTQPFTRILTANMSGFTEPTETVVRDAGALTSTWRTLYDGVAGNPAPTLDLASTTVAVVALGSRNTGGYAVRTDSVTVEGTNATVHYTVTSPGPQCMTTQMMTSPVEVISFARVQGQVRFIRRNVTDGC